MVRPHGDVVTVSAEKGYLKETGNLLFHGALLAVLAGVAVSSWYGWHGNRLLITGEDQAFCNTPSVYDEVALGTRMSAADLPPFCLQLDAFRATYLDTGQPSTFEADVRYDERGGPQRSKRLQVNDPLRLHHANVYLLGHGYAPVVRFTDRYGRTQTVISPFAPNDAVLTSTGVAVFPDANTDPAARFATRTSRSRSPACTCRPRPPTRPRVRRRFPRNGTLA